MTQPKSPQTDLIVTPLDAPLGPLEERPLSEPEKEKLEGLAAGAYAENTKRAYALAWKKFAGWCLQARRRPLPADPETLALYLEEHREIGLTALTHVLAAVRLIHAKAGIDPPPTSAHKVKMVWKAVRKLQGTAPKHAKDPITLTEMHQLLKTLNRETPAGKRDAAVILVGFWGAFRRSELVGIQVDHVEVFADGLVIRIPRSKTDQEGAGRIVGMMSRNDETCPVAALMAWLDVAKIAEGPVFRGFTPQGRIRGKALHPGEVAVIVKRAVANAGLEPEKFAGHSLRAGLVTEAYRQGAPEAEIMEQTGHKSATMLMRYRREADPISRGPTKRLKS